MRRDRDDDATPRDRLIIHAQAPEAHELGTLNNPSDHPRVKVARVWHSTIVTSLAITVIGGLAALQDWPAHLTLGALGGATGLWAFGALKR